MNEVPMYFHIDISLFRGGQVGVGGDGGVCGGESLVDRSGVWGCVDG